MDLPGFYFVCICLLSPCVKVGDSVPQLRVNYRIITNTDRTYGYDIFIDGKLRVHQPAIPGVQGTRGFLRKADAKKVAGLVVKKVQSGLMPPTVEARELDSLRIKR